MGARCRLPTSTRSPASSPPPPRAAGPGSACPASPTSSRRACAPSPWPTAPCARSSRPTSWTSRAARRRVHLMVDAVTGKVLHRQNQVENSNDVFPFQGAFTPGHVRAHARLRAHRRQHPDHRRRRRRRSTPPTTWSSSSSAPSGTLLASRRHRHQPGGGDLLRRLHPRRHLLRPGLPVRPARRCRSRRPTTTSLAVTTSDQGRRRPATGDQPALAAVPDQPVAGLARRAHADQLGRRPAGSRPRPTATTRSAPWRTRRRPGPWDTVAGSGVGDLDHGRQQRQHPRGVGEPADARRPAPGAGLADPAVHRRRSPTPGTTPGATPPSSSPAATTSTPR